jgi:uncharacterized repeat protein (TIGR01451 family)
VHLKMIIAALLLAFVVHSADGRGRSVPAAAVNGPLRLSTTTTPSTVAQGGALSFTTRIANMSPLPVAEVTLCDVLPGQVAALLDRGGTRLFDNRACRTFPEVPASASVTVRLVVRISRHARLGLARNTATVVWLAGRLSAHAGFRIGRSRPLCQFG